MILSTLPFKKLYPLSILLMTNYFVSKIFQFLTETTFIWTFTAILRKNKIDQEWKEGKFFNSFHYQCIL